MNFEEFLSEAADQGDAAHGEAIRKAADKHLKKMLAEKPQHSAMHKKDHKVLHNVADMVSKSSFISAHRIAQNVSDHAKDAIPARQKKLIDKLGS